MHAQTLQNGDTSIVITTTFREEHTKVSLYCLHLVNQTAFISLQKNQHQKILKKIDKGKGVAATSLVDYLPTI